MELYDKPETIVFTTPLPDLEKLNIDKDVAVLELGCGYGRILKHLYEQGYHNLTGIDLSEQLIERAKREFSQAQYFVGNIVDIDCEKKYDVVIICGVIEYIVSEEERDKLLDKIAKILNENGKVYLETFIRNEEDEIYERNVKKGFRLGHIKLDNGLELYHASVDEMNAFFKQHGFEVIEGRREEFVTWTDAVVAGYTCLYQKM